MKIRKTTHLDLTTPSGVNFKLQNTISSFQDMMMRMRGMQML
ncbi:MAG: hypothetical protein ACEPOZ_22030 [Marinifilaceae bacterium]